MSSKKPRKRNPGPPFERKVAKQLSLWWTAGESDAVFWRTAGSGGRATNRAKRGKATKNQSGDICAIDPVGQPFMDVFALEIKKGYAKFTPFDSFDAIAKSAPMFDAWIEQAKRSMVGNCSISWMIIFQRNGRTPVVATPRKIAGELNMKPCLPRMDLYRGDDRIAMFHLDRWLEWVHPEQIMKLVE